MRSLLGLRGCTRVKVGTGARSHMVKPSTRNDGYRGALANQHQTSQICTEVDIIQRASFSIQTRLSVNAIYPFLKRLLAECEEEYSHSNPLVIKKHNNPDGT